MCYIGVINTFVVEDPKSKQITDMCSFYTLPSTIIGNPKYSTLKAAYSFYNVATSVDLVRLMTDALILAKSVCISFFSFWFFFVYFQIILVKIRRVQCAGYLLQWGISGTSQIWKRRWSLAILFLQLEMPSHKTRKYGPGFDVTLPLYVCVSFLGDWRNHNKELKRIEKRERERKGLHGSIRSTRKIKEPKEKQNLVSFCESEKFICLFWRCRGRVIKMNEA